MSEKIKIETRDFGEQEIAKEDIIRFPRGLFAFEESRDFVLLSPLDEEASPMWLQSADASKPCFIVFKPMDFISDYKPEPMAEDLELIHFEEGDEIEYLSLAVIPQDYTKTTLNLKSPVAVNRTKRLAVQTILPDDYDLRFPLYKEVKGEQKCL